MIKNQEPRIINIDKVLKYKPRFFAYIIIFYINFRKLLTCF